MLQMLLLMHEVLTKAKQADYMREAEQYRRAAAAEGGHTSAQTTGAHTGTWLRQALARSGTIRSPRPHPLASGSPRRHRAA